MRLSLLPHVDKSDYCRLKRLKYGLLPAKQRGLRWYGEKGNE